MKRSRSMLGLVALAILMSQMAAAGASQGTPTPTASSSGVVGSWLDTDDNTLVSFAFNGTAIARHADGTLYLGAWEPDGNEGAMFILMTATSTTASEGYSGWARLDNDPTVLLIGEDSYERLAPPTLDEFLGRATPTP